MMAVKKVAVLTFHYAHNYGAVLQALALKKRLELMGFCPEIINYRNKKVDSRYKSGLKWRPRRKWLKPRHWPELFKQGAYIRYAAPAWEEKRRRFEAFIGGKIVPGQGAVSFEELCHLDTDAFIVGSDQIWDKGITGGLDRGYFLGFETAAKKISYAASMSSWRFTGKETRELRKYLSGFDAVSVREQAIAQKLKEYSQADIATAVDPTLLLDADAYSEWEETEILETEKYVFAYFVTESEKLMRCAQRAASVLGLKLLELHYYKLPELNGHNQIADIGPEQFLWYIKHAGFVITNSFHGTVFSILYGKPFYTVYKDGKNGRVQSLLAALKLTDRHVEDEGDIDVARPIDFENTKIRIEELRAGSIKFLQDALR